MVNAKDQVLWMEPEIEYIKILNNYYCSTNGSDFALRANSNDLDVTHKYKIFWFKFVMDKIIRNF